MGAVPCFGKITRAPRKTDDRLDFFSGAHSERSDKPPPGGMGRSARRWATMDSFRHVMAHGRLQDDCAIDELYHMDSRTSPGMSAADLDTSGQRPNPERVRPIRKTASDLLSFKTPPAWRYSGTVSAAVKDKSAGYILRFA